MFPSDQDKCESVCGDGADEQRVMLEMIGCMICLAQQKIACNFCCPCACELWAPPFTIEFSITPASPPYSKDGSQSCRS